MRFFRSYLSTLCYPLIPLWFRVCIANENNVVNTHSHSTHNHSRQKAEYLISWRWAVAGESDTGWITHFALFTDRLQNWHSRWLVIVVVAVGGGDGVMLLLAEKCPLYVYQCGWAIKKTSNLEEKHTHTRVNNWEFVLCSSRIFQSIRFSGSLLFLSIDTINLFSTFDYILLIDIHKHTQTHARTNKHNQNPKWKQLSVVLHSRSFRLRSVVVGIIYFCCPGLCVRQPFLMKNFTQKCKCGNHKQILICMACRCVYSLPPNYHEKKNATKLKDYNISTSIKRHNENQNKKNKPNKITNHKTEISFLTVLMCAEFFVVDFFFAHLFVHS